MMLPTFNESAYPQCSRNACPSYDGKRCRLTRFIPGPVCTPAVEDIAVKLLVLWACEVEPDGPRWQDHPIVIEALSAAADAYDARAAQLRSLRGSSEPHGEVG